MTGAPPSAAKRPRKVDIWFPTYIGDHLAEIAHLSTAEIGALHLLKLSFWKKGEPLPAASERLRQITRLERDQWAASEATLRAFFVADGEVLRHPEWERQRLQAEGNRAQKSGAGKASAEARKNRRSTDGATTSQTAMQLAPSAVTTAVGTGVATEEATAARSDDREKPRNAAPVATLVTASVATAVKNSTSVPSAVATDVATAGPTEGQRLGNSSIVQSEETSFGSPSDARETDGPPTRLPRHWTPGEEGVAFAIGEAMRVMRRDDPAAQSAASAWTMRTADKFRDYWLGKAAEKADWPATWRNWVRTEIDEGRGPVAPVAPVIVAPIEVLAPGEISADRWRIRLGRRRDHGHWFADWGSAPGERGCLAPADLLAEFGLPPTPPADGPDPDVMEIPKFLRREAV